MINKKGIGALGWILIIVIVLIIIGVIAYFVMSGNGSNIIPSGNSIPQPPALPSG